MWTPQIACFPFRENKIVKLPIGIEDFEELPCIRSRLSQPAMK
ncbi:hypothetical protein [Acetatifactor aquisgranensis]|nr:hypothetical protein [Acetatifactor aquisgranensis]